MKNRDFFYDFISYTMAIIIFIFSITLFLIIISKIQNKKHSIEKINISTLANKSKFKNLKSFNINFKLQARALRIIKAYDKKIKELDKHKCDQKSSKNSYNPMLLYIDDSDSSDDSDDLVCNFGDEDIKPKCIICTQIKESKDKKLQLEDCFYKYINKRKIILKICSSIDISYQDQISNLSNKDFIKRKKQELKEEYALMKDIERELRSLIKISKEA